MQESLYGKECWRKFPILGLCRVTCLLAGGGRPEPVHRTVSTPWNVPALLNLGKKPPVGLVGYPGLEELANWLLLSSLKPTSDPLISTLSGRFHHSQVSFHGLAQEATKPSAAGTKHLGVAQLISGSCSRSSARVPRAGVWCTQEPGLPAEEASEPRGRVGVQALRPRMEPCSKAWLASSVGWV